jgi:hypothetical protein
MYPRYTADRLHDHRLYTLAVHDFVASYLTQSLGMQDDPTKGHIVGLIATGAGATVIL